ncbi:MAG: MlaE family lipid ABC transporter permease subunit [Pseudomonadota bacterium]
MYKETTPANYINVTLESDKSHALIVLSGAWTVAHLPEEERKVSNFILPENITNITINGSGINEIDTSGAWLITSLVRKLKINPQQINWQGFSDSHAKLIKLASNIEHLELPIKSRSYFYNLLINFGKLCISIYQGSYDLIAFFGQVCTTFASAIVHPKKFRLKSIVFHINQIGIEAVPIIATMAFLISIVLGYQGAQQLSKFGASVYAINLVAISVLRDMGVLITAIMLAGRSGSAFAAQIGVMQMNDEIAAMRTIGLDPFELLIMPRIIAIIIILPILTFIADISGLLGTMFISDSLLGISPIEFMSKIGSVVNAHTFFIGLIKAPVFALFIGVAGCLQGMQVRISATELGERTTQAVVQSIFLVILGDAVFSVIFTLLGM